MRPKGRPKQKPRPATASATTTKKQARSIERLLRREGLPAEVRAKKQAELAALQEEGERGAKQRKRADRERAFSRKYRKIKLFDRKKVDRRLKMLRRKLDAAETSGGARDDLAAQMHEAECDMLYIRHFPRHKKYLALFPSDNAEDAVVASKRRKIRAAILRRAAAGTLEQPRDDGGEDEVDATVDDEALEDDFFDA